MDYINSSPKILFLGGASFISNSFNPFFENAIYCGKFINLKNFYGGVSIFGVVGDTYNFYPFKAKGRGEYLPMYFYANLERIWIGGALQGNIKHKLLQNTFISLNLSTNNVIPLFQNDWNIFFPNILVEWAGKKVYFFYEMGLLKNEKWNKLRNLHGFNIKISEYFSLQLWESVLSLTEDVKVKRGIELWYALGFLGFWRPIEYQIGSPDNVFMGGAFIFHHKKFKVMSSILIDDFYFNELKKQSKWWGNKWGILLETELANSTYLINLSLTYVRPYTYSYFSNQLANSHMNFPLGPEEGGNFIKTSFIGGKKISKLYFLTQAILLLQGMDDNNFSYGSDIFKSYTQRNADYGIPWINGKKLNKTILSLQFFGEIYRFYNNLLFITFLGDFFAIPQINFTKFNLGVGFKLLFCGDESKRNGDYNNISSFLINTSKKRTFLIFNNL